MRRLSIAALLFAAVLTGCSGEKRHNEPNTPAEAESTMAQQQNAPANPQAAPGKQAQNSRSRENVPPPQPQPTIVTRQVAIQPGTELPATLDQKISTETSHAGEGFTLTLAQGYTRNGVAVLPAGTKIRGDITESKRAPRVGGKAELSMDFREVVLPGGEVLPLAAEAVSMEGKSTTKGDVGKVVGGTVGGAIIGGILGGEKGAVRGGAAGAAGGTVWAVVTRGKDIVLEPGTPVHVTLSRELQVPVRMRTDQAVP